MIIIVESLYAKFVCLFTYLLIFRKKGREGERGGEKYRCMHEKYINWLPLEHTQLGTWTTTQACALSGNQTSDLLVCRPVLNPLRHTARAVYKVSVPICKFYLMSKKLRYLDLLKG